MSCVRALSLRTLALASRATLFTCYSLRAIRDPTDADAVGAVGELFAVPALRSMQRAMMSDRNGRAMLKNKPLVTNELLAYSQTLHPHSFGYRYAAYMTQNKFTPAARPAVRFIADATLSYVMTRYRQCHDFLHVCTGCGRSVEDELAVKLLEWEQTKLPLGLLSAVGGSPHLTPAQRTRVWGVYADWAAAHRPGNVACGAFCKSTTLAKPVEQKLNGASDGHDACVEGNNSDEASRLLPPPPQQRVKFYMNVPWEELLSWRYEDVVACTGIMPLADYMAQHSANRNSV